MSIEKKPDSSHVHGPHCKQTHQSTSASQRLGFVFFLNLVFTFIELIGGLLTNSLAIMSDALHDFGDSIGLGLAWWLEKYSNKDSDETHTYGYRRWSLLSAVISSLIIMIGSVFIIVHAGVRLFDQKVVYTPGVLLLALLGIVVNGIGYWRLTRGSSLNEKVLGYHLLEDLAGWMVVLIGAIVIHFTSWYWVDPLLAIGLAIWIFVHVFGHFKESVKILMQVTPLDVDLVKQSLLSFTGVVDIHHIHCWSIDGQSHIASVHVVVDSQVSKQDWIETKKKIKQMLVEQWKIVEVTLESEWPDEICHDPHHTKIGDSK